jgi:hypothetical protein
VQPQSESDGPSNSSQLTGGAGAHDHVELVGVGEQLDDVVGDERAIGLGQDDVVAGRVAQAALECVAVPLLLLEHDAGAGRAREIAGAVMGVVVDDEHLVDGRDGLEIADGPRDIGGLVVGREDDRDSLAIAPHVGQPSSR